MHHKTTKDFLSLQEGLTLCRGHHVEPMTLAALFQSHPQIITSKYPQYSIIYTYLLQMGQLARAAATMSTAVSSFMSPGAHFVPPAVRYMPAAPVASPSSGRLPQSAMKTLMSNFLHKLDTAFPTESSASLEHRATEAYTALNTWLSRYCMERSIIPALTLSQLLRDYPGALPQSGQKGYSRLNYIQKNLPSLEAKSKGVKKILRHVETKNRHLAAVSTTLNSTPLMPIDTVIADIADREVSMEEPSLQAVYADSIASNIKRELGFIYGQIKEIQTGITMPAAVSLGNGPSMYGTPPRPTSTIPSPEPTPAAVTRVAPAPFLCAISGDVMQDPVIGSDGLNYERSAIEAALIANPYSTTGIPMAIDDLYPNRALKELIEAWQSPAESREAPSQYDCPISYELMDDPVIAPDGHTYERTVIEGMIDRNAPSPFTREAMTKESLRPNHALRELITTWKEKHPEPASVPHL